MAPDPAAIAAAACAGRWGTDPLTERLARLGGWSGPDELAGVVGALVARRRRAPRGSPAGVEAEVATLLAGPRRHRTVVQPDPVWRLPVPRWTTCPPWPPPCTSTTASSPGSPTPAAGGAAPRTAR